MADISIPHQRLYNQQIASPKYQTPAEVVAALGALQGQDYAGAKWSIGLRLPGSTDAEIERAIADKQIVRTWINRGTLHLTAAEDVCWLVNLIGPRSIAIAAPRYKELELDENTFTRSFTILLDALEGEKELTRKELFAILEGQGISTQGQRGVHILQRASLDGLICQGIEDRRNPMFYRVDALPITPKDLEREEALAELARRYFTSHGPATLHDFAWWTGLLMADVKTGFEAVKSELVEVGVDGTSYWQSASAGEPCDLPGVFALPGFDEYILGYKDRNIVLDPQFANEICPGGNGVFYPTIVIDGQVIGTWKRSIKKDVMTVTVSPFTALNENDLRGFRTALQRYGEFMGIHAVLS